MVAPIDIIEDFNAEHRAKEMSKVQLLKQKYEDLKKNENYKKFSNSSFLTPEAASYLNELVKAN